MPFFLSLSLTACGTNIPVVVEIPEPPTIALAVSPSSVTIPVGETAKPIPVNIVGWVGASSSSFQVVVTESHNGSPRREVCRRAQTQFTCTDTLPADTGVSTYIYVATVTDRFNNRSDATAIVQVNRIVP